VIAALFDVDGTLYSAQFGRGLMKYARAHGRRLHAAAYFASILPAFLLNKLKLTDSEPVDRAKISRLGWLIRGWDEPQVLRAFAWVTEEYLLATRRVHVIKRLQDHQAQGHLAVVLSGTFTPSLQLLGQRLDVSELVGTRLETKDGRYTGRIIPPIIKGADKAARAVQHLANRKPAIDWAASYAYGDSYSDRDMLGLVGNPVAVHPEAKLRGLAQEKNWQVLETPSIESGAKP
jgi:HAD superfamily hydrolase (TIGR01490 family)